MSNSVANCCESYLSYYGVDNSVLENSVLGVTHHIKRMTSMGFLN